MKKKISAGIVWVLLLCLLGGCEERRDSLVLELQETQTEAQEQESAVQETQAARIYVDVCGAVKKPGVYCLDAGARVYEAVALAGGMLPEADACALNQAETLADGAQVRIYTVEETSQGLEDASGNAVRTEDGLVNLNTAGIEELCTLSGIGESRAADIISYRESQGGFGCIEDIMNVSGIKDATFQKIKDKIAVK